MEIYVKIKKKELLPEIIKIVSYMWKKDIQFSRAADTMEFRDATFFCLKWDKTFDDSRWSGNSRFSKDIEFDIPQNIDNYNEPILAEADDDILFVDKRALYRAILLIAESSEGKISEDKKNWITPKEFKKKYKKYIDSDFDYANEVSLKGEN